MGAQVSTCQKISRNKVISSHFQHDAVRNKHAGWKLKKHQNNIRTMGPAICFTPFSPWNTILVSGTCRSIPRVWLADAGRTQGLHPTSRWLRPVLLDVAGLMLCGPQLGGRPRWMVPYSCSWPFYTFRMVLISWKV